MPRRRLRDTEAWLEANATNLNPEAYRQYRQELTEAQSAAAAFADQSAQQRYQEMTERRTELLATMCDIRDGLAELAEQGRTGRIDAADYHARLERLSAAHDQANGARGVALMNRAVDAVADIEAGPREVLATDRDGAPITLGDRPEEWSPSDYADAYNDRMSNGPANTHHEFTF